MKLSLPSLMPIATLLALPAIACVNAQVRLTTLDPGVLAAHARASGDVSDLKRALAQRDGPHDHRLLDALADSLTAMIGTGPNAQPGNFQLRDAAMDALMWAGGRSAHVPYQGAGDRLLLLALSATNSGDSGSATQAITELANQKQAVTLLRTIAVSQRSVAAAAVGHLATAMASAGGLDILHELFRSHAITETDALGTLNRIAIQQGWAPPP